MRWIYAIVCMPLATLLFGLLFPTMCIDTIHMSGSIEFYAFTGMAFGMVVGVITSRLLSNERQKRVRDISEALGKHTPKNKVKNAVYSIFGWAGIFVIVLTITVVILFFVAMSYVV